MRDLETEWAALLRAANNGDGRSFARFLHAVTPMVRGIIRARGATLGADQQEDIVQEVLLAIHLKRQTWDESRPVRPWLYAIARYKIVDAFRARGAHVHLPIEDFAEVIPAETGDPTASRDVEVLLDRIDARSAEIVRAVSLRGEATQEVGTRIGMSDGAVRVALHRAMKRLSEIGQKQRR